MKSGVRSAECGVKALSPAQRIVLRGIAEGKKPNANAGQIGVSEHGVKWHRQEIYRKLGIHSIAEATRIAMRAGLLL